MHFEEKNKIIPDTLEDEELLSLGKANKQIKFYSAYIYRTLLEEASQDNPLKVKDICLKIIEKFNVYIDITTIQDHIKDIRENNVMPDIEILGKPHSGYYIKSMDNSLFLSEDDRLEDYQIHYLVNIIRGSSKLIAKEKNLLINKLSSMCLDEDTQEYLLDKSIFNKNVDTHTARISSRLHYDLPEIISKQLVIEITEKSMMEGLQPLKPRKFYTYAILPRGESFILIGSYSLTGMARFVFINRIKDYRILDETFKKEKLVLKLSVFLSDEGIQILQKENKNDFIFPTESELKQRQQNIERVNKGRLKK